MHSTAILSGLQQLGYERYDLAAQLGVSALDEGFHTLALEFDNLPVDPYAESSGRFRRFGRGVLLPWSGEFDWMPETAADASSDAVNRYQQGTHNPEYADQVRQLPSLTEAIKNSSLLAELIRFDFARTSWHDEDRCWPIHVGVHLIKLSVAGPGARAAATPDMLHQDGEPYTFAHLIYRCNASGGENVIAAAQCAGKSPDDVPEDSVLARFTLSRPLDSYGVKDDMVSHYVAPVTAGPGPGPSERAILLIDFTPMTQRPHAGP
ncbi:2OG-Fe dioxygenase family protein [Amycolatopsis minnesotensis]|uniref:2OG-Fe dioxygenase family protein n=1 Tax=Amycolatopsis minnesotensis TaxID=337894 RepID=A0ABP5DKY9_9PSEU